MTILIGSISQSRHDPTIVLTADDCSTETNEDGAESSNGPVQKLFCEESWPFALAQHGHNKLFPVNQEFLGKRYKNPEKKIDGLLNRLVGHLKTNPPLDWDDLISQIRDKLEPLVYNTFAHKFSAKFVGIWVAGFANATTPEICEIAWNRNTDAKLTQRPGPLILDGSLERFIDARLRTTTPTDNAEGYHDQLFDSLKDRQVLVTADEFIKGKHRVIIKPTKGGWLIEYSKAKHRAAE